MIQISFILSLCILAAVVVCVAMAAATMALPPKNTVMLTDLQGAVTPMAYLASIALDYDGSSGIYNAHFFVGKNKVQAAFDTGSARFIVSTKECGECAGADYHPVQSEIVLDAQSGGKTFCQEKVMYVSQTDTIQVFSDTVQFPLVGMDACDLDGKEAKSAKPMNTLFISSFPVGGIVENSGDSAHNILGMSGVVSVNITQHNGKGKYVVQSCQLSDSPHYESAVLQSVAEYNKSVGEPLMWSIQFFRNRSAGAFVSFRRPMLRCSSVRYVPAVRVLPGAPNDLVGTPWRYYVVRVKKARTHVGEMPIHGFPKFLIIDTGTTQFMLPPAVNAADVQRQGLVLTLEGDVELAWKNPQAYNDDTTTVFENMTEEVASLFSKNNEVGIFGNLAMLGMYIEFTFGEQRLVGFG